MEERVKEKLRRIRLLASDFDGVMTDGTIFIREDGMQTVRCSRKDGMAVDLLRYAGIHVCVISREINRVVETRCAILGIPCVQGVLDAEGKRVVLERIALEQGIPRDAVAYVGDDVNDLAALEYAELAITVADGHPAVKAVCHYVTMARGGEHVVREIADALLRAQGKPYRLT